MMIMHYTPFYSSLQKGVLSLGETSEIDLQSKGNQYEA